MASLESWVERHFPLISLAGGVIATIVTITVFAFSTFATKEEIRLNSDRDEKRLERIENKIDSIIESQITKGR